MTKRLRIRRRRHYGRWRRWLRTARCGGGVARPLHAEDHSPPPRGRKGPMRAPTESGMEASLERGPSLPGLCWLSFRRAIDDSAQRRPSWTGARSRTPQSWVGSLGDSKPFDPTAPCGPLRVCMPVVCPSHQKIDFDNLHRSPRNQQGVPVYSAKRISNRRYRLERANPDALINVGSC